MRTQSIRVFARVTALGGGLVLAAACGSTGSPHTGENPTSGNDIAANQSTRPAPSEVAGERLNRTDTITVTPYERDAFLELALQPAVAVPERHPVLGRWTRNPHLGVSGDPTPDDLRRLAEAAERWSLITGLTITVGMGTGDVDIKFVHRADFASVLDIDHVDPTAVGLSRVTFAPNQRGTITSAVVVIADDDAQVGRNRTIAHEIGHALGLQHSTCMSSLMDGSSNGERSVRWSPSPLDARMASMLYSPALRPGLDTEAVDRRLNPSATIGATCSPVDLELVQANGSGRHYLCARGAQVVRPCTANLSREPTLPIVNPDAWTDGESLSSHPPR